jgi:hypothetical protein
VEARPRPAGDGGAAVRLDGFAHLTCGRPLEPVAEDAAESRDVVADDVLAVHDDARSKRVVAGRLAVGAGRPGAQRRAEDRKRRHSDQS